MNKRIISLCLALVLLLCLLPAASPTVAAAGDVAINETNFPDEKFRNIVKQYDIDSDNILSPDEIAGGLQLFSLADKDFRKRGQKGRKEKCLYLIIIYYKVTFIIE